MTILSFTDEALTGKVATFKRTKRPSYVDINSDDIRSVTTGGGGVEKYQSASAILADEDKQNALPQRYFIESHKSAYYNPNDSQLKGCQHKTDHNVNVNHNLNPGRLSVRLDLLLSLLNPLKFITRSVVLTFEACLFNSVCYTPLDNSSYHMLKEGNIKQFYHYRELERQKALKN